MSFPSFTIPLSTYNRGVIMYSELMHCAGDFCKKVAKLKQNFFKINFWITIFKTKSKIQDKPK